MERAFARVARGRVAHIRAVGPVRIRVAARVQAGIWVADLVAVLTFPALAQVAVVTCPAAVAADTRVVVLTANDERVVF